jgi:hypothetical protein
MVISAVFEHPVILTGIEVTAPAKTVYKTGFLRSEVHRTWKLGKTDEG